MKLLKSALILTSLTASSLANANFFPNDWEDSDEGIFQATIEGQYFYQSNNLALANENPDKLTDFTILHKTNPDDEWGYRASLAYIFASQNWDLRASYWQVRADNSLDSFQSDPNLIFTGSQENNYDFKAAELTLGQYFALSCCLEMRIGYGIVYGNIKQNADGLIDVNLAANGMLVGGGENIFENSFKGIGPKLGLDLEWDMNQSIALVGGVGASVLFGEADAKYTAISSGATRVSESIKQEDDRSVFQTDAKLGASYTQVLNDDFAFDIEAGYRGSYYFDAMLKQEEQEIVTGTIININNNDNDYYNYGPYINLTVDFM